MSLNYNNAVSFYSNRELGEDIKRDRVLLPNAKFNYLTIPKTLLNFSEVFTDLGVIGKGAYGEVHRVQQTRTNKQYALKYLNNADPEILEEEIGVLREISSYPNCRDDVVCYYDAFQFRDKTGKIIYGVLMEYIDGQTLEKYIKDDVPEPSTLRLIALLLTRTLEDLHAAGFYHRDIKPGNIMISYDGKLKLIDFGLACINHNVDGAHVCRDAVIGTPGYIPPDITRLQFADDIDRQLAAADIFAAGVTLYQVANNMYEPYKVARNLHIYGHFSPSLYKFPCYNDVIEKMLDFDYLRRPTAVDAYDEFEQCELP